MCSYIFNRETVFIRVGISFTSFSPPIRSHAPFMRETRRRMKRKTVCRWGSCPPAKLEVENPIRGPASLPHSCGIWLPWALSLRAVAPTHSPHPVPPEVLAQGSPSLADLFSVRQSKDKLFARGQKGGTPPPVSPPRSQTYLLPTLSCGRAE